MLLYIGTGDMVIRVVVRSRRLPLVFFNLGRPTVPTNGHRRRCRCIINYSLYTHTRTIAIICAHKPQINVKQKKNV